jgi:hypothetical protein
MFGNMYGGVISWLIWLSIHHPGWLNAMFYIKKTFTVNKLEGFI